MLELVQLEKSHDEFAKRNARVIAVSVEGLDDAQKTQEQFPHLVVLSDEALELTNAAQILQKGAHPNGSDVDAPTTFIVDKSGQVRWLFRSEHVFHRLTPGELLAEFDRVMK